MMSFILLVMV